jgi:hypothetical protein
MPGKGPSQQGTQTKTETNPLAQAQGNLLQGAWGGPGFERPGTAVDLATNNPITAYPGQTYANPTEQQYTGLNNLFNAGGIAQGALFNGAINPFNLGTSGQFGYTNSPSYNSLMPYAGGSAAPQQFATSNAGTVLDMANKSGAVAPDLYSRLIGYGNQAAGAGSAYAPQIAGAGSQYGTGLRDLSGQSANAGAGYAGNLQGAGAQSAALGQQYGTGLDLVGQNAANLGIGYGNQLSQAAGGALGSGQQYADMLAGTGYQAGGAGAQAARGLNQLAGQIPGMTAPAANLLGYNAATAVVGNPATQYLQQEASGGNFGNPYLSSLYDTAARGVTGQFQTGTAPRLASQAAAAGRYGSGILANQEKQAYDQFGTNLTDLAAKLYTPAYAQDRSQQLAAAQSLGTQYGTNLATGTQAAQALGNLGLGSADAIRNALTGASQQRLQGLQQQGTSLGAAATAGQGAYGQYLSGLGTAAQEANRGLATQAGALGSGGQLGLQGAGQNVTAQGNAATAGLQGLQQAGTQLQAGGALDINSLIAANQAQQSGLQNAISAAQAGGNQYLTGLSNAGTLAGNAGTLNLGVGTQQLNALRDLQGAYQSGIGNQFTAANMAPGLANLLAGGAQRQLDVGTQYQTLDQAQLADAQRRFNDQQMAPRQNLDTLIKELSGNFGPNTTSTAPIYGSPLGQALGAAGSLNNLLGSGGLNLGGLSGVGSGIGSALGLGGGTAASVLGGIGSGALPAVIAPEIGAAGLGSLAAMNAGTGIGASLASALPAAAATIICTELVKQGKMPDTWRKAGMRQFMRYPEIARRGYWVWATPVVQHLRKKPDSRFSKLIAKTFNWRAEDLAARNGIKGARRLIRGRIVTAAMVIPCLACGLVARKGYSPTLKDAPV